MKQPDIQKLKEFIVEPIPKEILSGGGFYTAGQLNAMWNFSLALKEAEVETIDALEDLRKHSHDLNHFCGIHKWKFMTGKAEQLRHFWGNLWESRIDVLQHYGLKEYIEFLMENSAYRAGRSRRSYQLFGTVYYFENKRPWRTPKWYAERQPKRIPHIPLTEFYPYISYAPDEDHALLLAVDALVPKYLPNQTRADVCQDMIVSVLSGDVSVENLKDATGEYVKRFFKQHPMKYGHISLDAPIRKGERMTIGEMIAAR